MSMGSFFLMAIPTTLSFYFLFFSFVRWADNEPCIFNGFGFMQMNDLFICGEKDCGRMYRKYQSDKDNELCPHCNRHNYFPKKIDEEEWMNHHADCPKQTVWSYIKLKRDLKNIQKHKEDLKKIEFFEEYSKKNPNVDWVKNLAERK